jgi:hypothetical protein
VMQDHENKREAAVDAMTRRVSPAWRVKPNGMGQGCHWTPATATGNTHRISPRLSIYAYDVMFGADGA